MLGDERGKKKKKKKEKLLFLFLARDAHCVYVGSAVLRF